MSSHLIVAPAASGKTAHVVALARQAAEGLRASPIVVVAGQLQVRAWKSRLATAGGAIGVRVVTFYGLYAECLAAAGEAYTELVDPVRYRLIRAVLDRLPLVHYAPLVRRPGFVQVLAELIAELKTAMIPPRALAQAVEAMGAGPRLGELAKVYAAYQDWLQAEGWADAAGLGWLAAEALEKRAPQAGSEWPSVFVDGFDDLTPVQMEILRFLSSRAGELVVTLTGTADGSSRPQAHRRFERTQGLLRKALEPHLERRSSDPTRVPRLPGSSWARSPVLQKLEECLFQGSSEPLEAQRAIEMVEAPDRASEVREALRWLKFRIVQEGMRSNEVALLARDIAPYRPFVLQTAAEFGLPVRMSGGLPLRTNPAIAALLDLVRLALPCTADDPRPVLPRRRVVEAWRSPCFDWGPVLGGGDTKTPGGLAAAADALDASARWGRVIEGLDQWRDALGHLAALATGTMERDIPAEVPIGAGAAALRDRFERFVERISPPSGPKPALEYVGWLEDLIGPDPEIDPRHEVQQVTTQPLPHLGMVGRAWAGRVDLAERDVAALRALKDVLRGLVWAEEALGAGAGVDYPRFVEELIGAVAAASYDLPAHPERDEIVVASAGQVRGVGFRAAAILGLAEGEFPATMREDPFLTDADRRRLASLGVDLESSTESAEAELFYDAVTRAGERLLLTRPRLADNGALWQASPFWEEVRRLVRAEPARLTSESPIPPAQAASWTELMEALASGAGDGRLRAWAATEQPERHQALEQATGVLRLREEGIGNRAFDGDLSTVADALGMRYGSSHVWSASRLESYCGCPFSFFVGSALELTPRLEPEEGLDVAQRGTLYHRILEQVYRHPRVSDPLDPAHLLAVLPEVAGRVLDDAPEKEGFRETAWWAQTREEIAADVGRTLEELAELPSEFVPRRFEARFGLGGEPPLVVRTGEGRFLLHGVIDRIDLSDDGRARVIDYKSGGPSGYTLKSVTQGKKLQLPLYAVAVRDSLGLGEPVEGFYWHVRKAEPSPFRLSGGEGPEALMRTTAEKAMEAIQGVRAGRFAPQPPEEGCPSWCPAAGFCWHLRPRFEG